jgi:voltage-gated potassium channel
MVRFRHIVIILILLLLVASGTFGYSYLEGWSIHESLYMTVITLTTTGFQEVHHMSDAGRNLTMGLLIIGMGTVAYSVSVIMNDLLSINFETRRKKKMDREISKMKDHTIICGFGRMGKIIAEEISKVHSNFLIIEKNTKILKQLEHLNFKYIEGDSTHDEILLRAGIKNAKILVSMIDSDADALYLALAARTFNPDLQIIVRASEEEARPKILRAGANKVVLPVLMSGVKVAQAILNPAIEDYFDLSGVNDYLKGDMYQLADISVLKHSKLVGKTIKECMFQASGLVVVGIKKDNHEFIFSPKHDYKCEVGDVLLTLGTKASYNKVIEKFEIDCKN